MRAGALILGVLSVAAAPAWSQAPEFSPADRARLDSGEVLVKSIEPKGDGIAGKAAAVVAAAPDKVWAVVNDCAHFKDFMPRTVDSKLLEEGRHCRVEVEMPFPFSNLWSETKVRQIFLDGGGRRRQWSLVRGTYKSVDGSWTVWPWTDGRSLLLYVIEADPDVPIPNAIMRSAQSSTLPDMYVAIRKRAGDATFTAKD